MGRTEFQLGILYTTIAVIQPNEDFNDWNDVHVQQGFAWRPTSVSFGTLSDVPECTVVVKTSDAVAVNEEAERVIIVPFTVGKDGIEIASIADAQPIHISEEHYALIFSALPATINLFETYEFTFVKSEKVEASI